MNNLYILVPTAAAGLKISIQECIVISMLSLVTSLSSIQYKLSFFDMRWVLQLSGILCQDILGWSQILMGIWGLCDLGVLANTRLTSTKCQVNPLFVSQCIANAGHII